MVAYVDESYVVDRDYYVAVSLVEDTSVEGLNSRFRALSRDVSVTHGLSEQEPELHGSELFNGKGAFKRMHADPGARISLYHGGLVAFAEAEPAVLIVHAGWREGRSVSEHRLAVIAAALPIIDRELSDRQASADLVADREPSTEVQVAEAFAGHLARESPSSMRTLSFVDSRTSGGIQGTDLLLYLHRRLAGDRDRTGHRRAKRTNQWLWSHISDSVIGEHLVSVP